MSYVLALVYYCNHSPVKDLSLHKMLLSISINAFDFLVQENGNFHVIMHILYIAFHSFYNYIGSPSTPVTTSVNDSICFSAYSNPKSPVLYYNVSITDVTGS